MDPNTTAIERAFQLARLGTYLNVSEIKERLHVDGYPTDTISGPHLYEQLKSAIRAGRGNRWPVTPPELPRRDPDRPLGNSRHSQWLAMR
jgi:hypothetical protein